MQYPHISPKIAASILHSLQYPHISPIITVDILHSLQFSHMDYFSMNLHAGIASRPWSSFKGAPNYILGISKRPYMWVLHLRLPFHFRFYLIHLWVILKWTWIWLLHLGLISRIILTHYIIILTNNLCTIYRKSI